MEDSRLLDPIEPTPRSKYFRFHLPHTHLGSVFGDDWFSRKAESFARFFGTPIFIVVQTLIVAGWILSNVLGLVRFDYYPFILLNLAFSLQAAYAAPLILLAQTRQADRDKAHAEADARHREDLSIAGLEKQTDAGKKSQLIFELLQENTKITEMLADLTERIEVLTREVHGKIVRE